jgi:hypothetical protein
MNPKATWHRIVDPEDEAKSKKGNGSGTWIKWAACEVGYELEGVWLGTKPGKKYSDFGVVKIADGTSVCFGLTKVLTKLLARVKIGSLVAIVYLGSRTTASGDGTYHLFEVYSTKPGTAPTPSDRVEPADDDDPVPF